MQCIPVLGTCRLRKKGPVDATKKGKTTRTGSCDPLILQASAAAAKAKFDKFAADKAEEKAEFDLVLAQSVKETAAQKAVADKALLDMGEMEVGVEVCCGATCCEPGLAPYRMPASYLLDLDAFPATAAATSTA